MDKVSTEGGRDGANADQRVGGSVFVDSEKDPSLSTGVVSATGERRGARGRGGTAKEESVLGEGRAQRSKVGVLEGKEMSLYKVEQ